MNLTKLRRTPGRKLTALPDSGTLGFMPTGRAPAIVVGDKQVELRALHSNDTSDERESRCPFSVGNARARAHCLLSVPPPVRPTRF